MRNSKLLVGRGRRKSLCGLFLIPSSAGTTCFMEFISQYCSPERSFSWVGSSASALILISTISVTFILYAWINPIHNAIRFMSMLCMVTWNQGYETQFYNEILKMTQFHKSTLHEVAWLFVLYLHRPYSPNKSYKPHSQHGRNWVYVKNTGVHSPPDQWGFCSRTPCG